MLIHVALDDGNREDRNEEVKLSSQDRFLHVAGIQQFKYLS